MTETWYLLYGGDSVDGTGPGEYEGRTCNVFAAAMHYMKIDYPYSPGYVEVITDKEVIRYSTILGYKPATSELKEAIKQLQQEDQ